MLFITSTRVGDAILSTGLLGKVISDNSNIKITIACGPAAAPLFRCVPGLERIIVLDKMLFSLHWLRLWVLCIGTYWDIVIDLRNAPVTYLLLRGSRHGVPRSTGLERRVERLARVLDPEFVADPILWTDEKEESLAHKLIPSGEPVIAVGPTANWRAKTWRSENFSELIRRLSGPHGILPGSRIAIFGRDDERPMVFNLISDIPEERRIDLVGNLNLLQAYACLKRCSLYVGNDSGLMHLAAASGIPTLALFGPTPDLLYAPWGDYTSVVRTKAGMEEIFPEKFDHRASDSLMDSLSVEMAEKGANDLWLRFKESKE